MKNMLLLSIFVLFIGCGSSEDFVINHSGKEFCAIQSQQNAGVISHRLEISEDNFAVEITHGSVSVLASPHRVYSFRKQECDVFTLANTFVHIDCIDEAKNISVFVDYETNCFD